MPKASVAIAEPIAAEHVDDLLARRIGIEDQIDLRLRRGIFAKGVVQQMVENFAMYPSISSGVKLLIKAGANVNIVHDDAQETALNVAVEQGYIYIVKLLIKRNVNLYYEKYDGVTALDIAIENSESQYNIKIIKLLLNALMYA